MTETATARPISDSADGRLNSYSFHCNAIEQRRVYPVCVRLVANQNEKHLELLYPDCIAAIKKRVCPAIQMRSEEESAGHAIYFSDRHSEMPATVTPVSTIKPTRVSEPKPKGLLDNINNDGYTAALNKAIDAVSAPPVKKEEVVVKAPGTKPAAEIKPKSGESLMDMAKRLIAAKNLSKE